MEDSSVNISNGGIMYAGPDAVRLFHAAALRSGIRLLKVGIKPSRGWTMTKALAMCAQYTGKKYKRTQADEAMADLTIWIETMKSAIPINRE